MKYRISIVIVNYISYEDTIQYIEQIKCQKGVDINIVVVDNKSPNNSFEELLSFSKSRENIFVLNSGKNGGYSYGNNVGLKFVVEHKLSELVVISNNDLVFRDEYFLLKLICKYGELPERKAFISAVMYYQGKASRNAAKRLPSMISEIIDGSMILQKIFKSKSDYDFNEKHGSMEVDCLPGSFFLGAIELFEQIGFFDENLFLYGEERILGEKVKMLGLTNYLIRDLKYTHIVSKTIDRSIGKLVQFRLQSKGKIYYWRSYKNKYLFAVGLELFLKCCEMERLIIWTFKRIIASKNIIPKSI